MPKFARKHYRVVKKDVENEASTVYRIKEETAVLIAVIVILALLGAFVKGAIVGRWITKK